MRYVELFRHTDNDDDSLTREGIAAAESIGRERLSPPYAFFGTTGAHRATQMVEILQRAADRLVGGDAAGGDQRARRAELLVKQF